jgi:hypothetical protein
MTPVNRVVLALTARSHPRSVNRAALEPWIEESLRSLVEAGASPAVVERVRAHSRTWTVSATPAPPEVWCGEILWNPAGAPEAVVYPDSPWGRLPFDLAFHVASQTGMDHLTSHLYRWIALADFSEEAACADQVRLMWRRRRVLPRLSAAVILLGLRAHKKIPVRELLRRCRAPLPR